MRQLNSRHFWWVSGKALEFNLPLVIPMHVILLDVNPCEKWFEMIVQCSTHGHGLMEFFFKTFALNYP